MPNPEHVNPRNFRVEQVLYDNGDFSVACGQTDNGVAMGARWNGDDGDAGYPKTFGNPVWFFFDEPVCIPFLASLLGRADARHDAILDTLRRLRG